MSIQCRLLTAEEFKELENKRRTDRQPMSSVFLPGMMWFTPWYHDPADLEDMRCLPAELAQAEAGGKFLSVHYLRTWASKRAPLTVVCPNGRQWCVDQVSEKGSGWAVAGEAPALVVAPSIVVPGYHGWLGNGGALPGWFTGDVEGRGPMGSPS